MKPFKVKVRENSNSFRWIFIWARNEITALKRARARYKKEAIFILPLRAEIIGEPRKPFEAMA